MISRLVAAADDGAGGLDVRLLDTLEYVRGRSELGSDTIFADTDRTPDDEFTASLDQSTLLRDDLDDSSSSSSSSLPADGSTPGRRRFSSPASAGLSQRAVQKIIEGGRGREGPLHVALVEDVLNGIAQAVRKKEQALLALPVESVSSSQVPPPPPSPSAASILSPPHPPPPPPASDEDDDFILARPSSRPSSQSADSNDSNLFLKPASITISEAPFDNAIYYDLPPPSISLFAEYNIFRDFESGARSTSFLTFASLRHFLKNYERQALSTFELLSSKFKNTVTELASSIVTLTAKSLGFLIANGDIESATTSNSSTPVVKFWQLLTSHSLPPSTPVKLKGVTSFGSDDAIFQSPSAARIERLLDFLDSGPYFVFLEIVCMGLLTLVGDSEYDIQTIESATSSALYVRPGVEARTIEECWVGLALWKEGKIHEKAAASDREAARRAAEHAEKLSQEKDRTSMIMSPTAVLFPMESTSAAATGSSSASTHAILHQPNSYDSSGPTASASAFIKNSRLLTKNRTDQLYHPSVLPLHMQNRTLIKLFDISSTSEPSVSELYKVTNGQQCKSCSSIPFLSLAYSFAFVHFSNSNVILFFYLFINLSFRHAYHRQGRDGQGIRCRRR